MNKVYLKENIIFPPEYIFLGTDGNPIWESQEKIIRKYFSINKIYEATLCVTLIDTQTMKPTKPSYLIRCDSGELKKVDAQFFNLLRDTNLNAILDEI